MIELRTAVSFQCPKPDFTKSCGYSEIDGSDTGHSARPWRTYLAGVAQIRLLLFEIPDVHSGTDRAWDVPAVRIRDRCLNLAVDSIPYL